jgi:eukaryotic-like serine/threonine-protein kinase
VAQDRWKEVERICQIAFDLSLHEQQQLLARECGEDSQLRAEIEELLAADREAKPIQEIVGEAASKFSAEQSGWIVEDLTGKTIGPYRVLRKVGEGGMSEVYQAADNSGPVERQVAIKVLRGEYRNAEMLARFDAERSILSHLNHPCIARLYGAGSTPLSRPFVAMEFVEGVRVTSYCDRMQMNVEQRVELVARIADAVQYAHNNLIVHRDIKPDNILVTQDGQPKLLDFGIAKLIADPSSGVEANLTVTGARMLTPGYASPEQILGEPITVATDVYSLGVVLFELLTGVPPAKLPGFRQTPSGGLAALVDLPTASSAVRSSVTGASGASQQRWRKLRGDLDNIVQAATRREPERRYGSMLEFAADLRRYARSEPVSARPDTIAYRARKFVQRNRGRLISAASALALLFGFSIVTLQQKRRAEVRLGEVQQLAGTVLTHADALVSVPGALDVRQKLVASVKDHLERLAPEASDSPAFLHRLAIGYQRLAGVQGVDSGNNLGRRDEAMASMTKSCDLLGTAIQGDPKNARFVRDAIGCDLALIGFLIEFGRQSEIDRTLVRAEQRFASVRAGLPLHELHEFEARLSLARFEIYKSRYDRKSALTAAEAAVHSYRKAHELSPLRGYKSAVAARLNTLASERLASSDTVGAARDWKESLQLDREFEISLPSPARLVGLISRLESGAEIHWNSINVCTGEMERAEAYLQEALQIGWASLKREPKNAAARLALRNSLSSLSFLLSHRKQRELATRHARDAVQLGIEFLDSAPRSPNASIGLGRAYLALAFATYGTPESAKALAESRTNVNRYRLLRKLPEAGDDPSVPILMGRAAGWLGKWAEAERWFQDAVNLLPKGAAAPASMMPHLAAQAYRGMAQANASLGHCTAALEWRDKAKAAYRNWPDFPESIRSTRFFREQVAAAEGSANPCR